MPIPIKTSRPPELVREIYTTGDNTPLRVDGDSLRATKVKISDPFSRENARKGVVQVLNNVRVLENQGDAVLADAGIANKDISFWDARQLARALSSRYRAIAKDALGAKCYPKLLGAVHAYERLRDASQTIGGVLVKTGPDLNAAGALYDAKDAATQCLQAEAAGVIESKTHLAEPAAKLVAGYLSDSDLLTLRSVATGK